MIGWFWLTLHHIFFFVRGETHLRFPSQAWATEKHMWGSFDASHWKCLLKSQCVLPSRIRFKSGGCCLTASALPADASPLSGATIKDSSIGSNFYIQRVRKCKETPWRNYEGRHIWPNPTLYHTSSINIIGVWMVCTVRHRVDWCGYDFYMPTYLFSDEIEL